MSVTVTKGHACLFLAAFSQTPTPQSLPTHRQLEHPETVDDDNDDDTDDGCTAKPEHRYH